MSTFSAPCVSLVVCFFALVAGNVDTDQLCNDESDRMCLSQYKTQEDLKLLVLKQFETITNNEKMQEDLRQLVTKQAEMHEDLRQVVVKQADIIVEMNKTIREQNKLIVTINDTLQDNTYHSTVSKENKSVTGSTFVRWGRTTCPGNGTDTVYSGYTGGSWYNDEGAAVNYLCLPTDPLWDKFNNRNDVGQHIYGTEYQIYHGYSETLFNKDIYDQEAPCAVCHSVRSSTMMIPGRNACYDGWTMEYAGYLVAGEHDKKAANEFVCLDNDPEVIPGTQANLNGKLMYTVEAKCGALKCPPYVDGRELTCVVCTR